MTTCELHELLDAYLAVFNRAMTIWQDSLLDRRGDEVWRAFAVEDAEASEVFVRLVTHIADHLGIRVSSATSAVRTFLRRSGSYFYPQDEGKILRQLVSNMSCVDNMSVTQVLSLPWISDEMELDMAGEGFRLTRMTHDGVVDVLSNHIRRCFYPNRAITDLEIQLRSHEAWLLVEECGERLCPGTISADFSVLRGLVSYTSLSAATEACLGSVLILDWQPTEDSLVSRDSWFPGYPIGLSARMSDDLFSDLGDTRRDDLG